MEAESIFSCKSLVKLFNFMSVKHKQQPQHTSHFKATKANYPINYHLYL